MMHCTINFFSDVTDRLQYKANSSELVTYCSTWYWLIHLVTEAKFADDPWVSIEVSMENYKKVGVKANAVKNLGSDLRYE